MKEESENQHNTKQDEFPKKLDEYIKSVVKNEGYVTHNIEKRNISAKGGGYIGVLYEVNVKGKTIEGDKETNLFLKNIVHCNTPLIYSVPESFKREHFVYNNLGKKLNELQDGANIPVGERHKTAEAFDESNEETIILENLTVKGFKTYYRMDVINLEYAELAVKNLSKFHALSFALEKRQTDYYKTLKNLKCIYNFNENWYGFAKNLLKFSTSFLKEDMKEKVELIEKIVDKYPDYMSDNSCVKTLCHGDYRHNNVMVREIDNKPAEVIAVDYQIIHLGNPVLDLIYFIFWGTDREFRRNHLENLKELYYQHMATFLKYFEIGIEDVFPRKEFEDQYQRKLDFGLIIGVLYLPFLFPPEDDVPDIMNTSDSLSEMSIKVDEEFQKRFGDIVADFNEWGYL